MSWKIQKNVVMRTDLSHLSRHILVHRVRTALLYAFN